jgi:hypothetical protein
MDPAEHEFFLKKKKNKNHIFKFFFPSNISNLVGQKHSYRQQQLRVGPAKLEKKFNF